MQTRPKTIFVDTMKRAKIKYHISAPRHLNENSSEGEIQDVKRRRYRIQENYKVPRRIRYYGISWIREMRNLKITSLRYSEDIMPIEVITGDTTDITDYLDFNFYDWVTFKKLSV